MANADRPAGFSPSGNIGGSPYNAQVRKYAVALGDGTALFVGDAVKSTGTANADGIPYVTQAAASNTIRGVVVGFEPEPTNLELQYRLASTERIVLVCDDPLAEFEVQEDSVGGALAVTAVGGNIEIVVGAGSTVSGRSGMEIDSSTATTSAAQIRIIGSVQRPDNEVGTNASWIVKINEHELLTAAGV